MGGLSAARPTAGVADALFTGPPGGPCRCPCGRVGTRPAALCPDRGIAATRTPPAERRPDSADQADAVGVRRLAFADHASPERDYGLIKQIVNTRSITVGVTHN